MAYPKAYEPEIGYMWQILCRYNCIEWEHCDYATDNKDKKHLLENYRMAYPSGYEFKCIYIPQKYRKDVYKVMNLTDGINANQELYFGKSGYEKAKLFITEFPKRYEIQGYYFTSNRERINPNDVRLSIEKVN